jgi:two-component system cell cycle response regulator CpdR
VDDPPAIIGGLPSPVEVSLKNNGAASMARILLAEDDGSLRGFLTRALERAGHEVTACENGDDAVDALEDGPWDLLLTDIVMPGADGIEVARIAANRQPGLRIMFITGFAAVALTAAQATPQAKVLSKPVHLRDLVAEVERMVAA